MEIKIKKTFLGKSTRFSTNGHIEEIMINENLVSPSSETLSLCFRGNNTSGIINIRGSEIRKLENAIKNLHLVKEVKRFP